MPCLYPQEGERADAIQKGEELGHTLSEREEEVLNVRLQLDSVNNRVSGEHTLTKSEQMY